MRLEALLEDFDLAKLEYWREKLSGKAEEIELRIREVQAELDTTLAPLRQEQQTVRQMIGLVRQMLELARGREVSDGDRPPVFQKANSPKELPDIAYQVLKELGTETYYRDLAARIIEQGYSIRGSDPATYLLAYIGKDPRFVKVKRGTYALTEWKPKRPAGKRKNRRPKHTRAVRTSVQSF